jgi:hypothetical protein
MSNVSPARSLKSQNLPWLVSLVVFDILVIVAFLFPGLFNAASLSQAGIARALIALVLPVVVLLLAGLLPHSLKASLVYWKINEALPAHEAFTKHGPSDARVDMTALRAHVGELPTASSEQNRVWFKLYKATENAPTVLEAHKMYLLYRDMAAMSFLLLIAAPAGLYLSRFNLGAVSTTAAVFALQFLSTAISARHSGVRLVTNVMSIHSATTPAPRPPAKKERPPRGSHSAPRRTHENRSGLSEESARSLRGLARADLLRAGFQSGKPRSQ